MPEFVDPDDVTKRYGPFKSGETAEFPEHITEIFMSRKMVEAGV
jgi:hypothetical protein